MCFAAPRPRPIASSHSVVPQRSVLCVRACVRERGSRASRRHERRRVRGACRQGGRAAAAQLALADDAEAAARRMLAGGPGGKVRAVPPVQPVPPHLSCRSGVAAPCCTCGGASFLCALWRPCGWRFFWRVDAAQAAVGAHGERHSSARKAPLGCSQARVLAARAAARSHTARGDAGGQGAAKSSAITDVAARTHVFDVAVGVSE
eukprot:7375810-Prymnesium_polylepis.1